MCGRYYLTYVNSHRTSAGVAYVFDTTCTRFLQTLSKPELIVNQYYSFFEKQDDMLNMFFSSKGCRYVTQLQDR